MIFARGNSYENFCSATGFHDFDMRSDILKDEIGKLVVNERLLVLQCLKSSGVVIPLNEEKKISEQKLAAIVATTIRTNPVFIKKLAECISRFGLQGYSGVSKKKFGKAFLNFDENAKLNKVEETLNDMASSMKVKRDGNDGKPSVDEEDIVERVNRSLAGTDGATTGQEPVIIYKLDKKTKIAFGVAFAFAIGLIVWLWRKNDKLEALALDGTENIGTSVESSPIPEPPAYGTNNPYVQPIPVTPNPAPTPTAPATTIINNSTTPNV